MSLDFNCPSCKSDATQKLSVVYQGGFSNINTTSTTGGIGAGRGGLGIGVGRTKTSGVSQTALSEKASPPIKKRYIKPLGSILLACVVLSLFLRSNSTVVNALISLIWPVASIAWVVYAYRYNSNIWPGLYEAWDKMFLCGRCDTMFKPTAAVKTLPAAEMVA